MPMTAAMAQALGNLIEALNPYSSIARQAQYPTGEMDLYAGNSAPTVPPSGTPLQIEMEVDDKYAGEHAAEWNFKGQSWRIAKAVRIRYRIPVLSGPAGAAGTTVLHYLDDYLLIGFEGSDGG
jgi:hypothetical protein